MTAKYQFFKNPPSSLVETDAKQVLHVRIVNRDILSFKDLCERIAGRSTFNAGEVEGIMSLFKEEMVSALSDGDRVELEDIGIFEATASCPPVSDPKKIRAESIHFSRVVFRAAKSLRRKMNLMRFERAAGFGKQETFPEEERRARILRYLQRNEEIRSSTCMGLNACSRYQAQADLSGLNASGNILRLGGPKMAVYVLANKEEAK